MTKFVASNPKVQVHLNVVNAIVNSMENGKETRLEILKENNIDVFHSDSWIFQQDVLNAYKGIATRLGIMNLFVIGKAIIDNVKFPPIENLEKGLKSIDIAYHLSHRLDGKVMFDNISGKITNGIIGNYSLTIFDENKRIAEMLCDTPYPSEFERGIITQVLRKFKPIGARENVETHINSDESCTYKISW